MATPMFDKLREMNSSTPTVQLMKKTAEQQRKEKAAATGTPYKVKQTPTATKTPEPVYGAYTGKVSSSYVPGSLGNQKVGGSSGGGGGTSIDPGNTPPPDFDYTDVDLGGGGSGFTSSDYYQQMLDAQQKAIQQRIDAAVQKNNAYIPQVNQRSDQSLQNAYILKQQNLVNAPQALSAMGMQGGAAESSLMGINTGYENTRNEVEQNRGNSLNEIYQNEQQIRATGDATLSEASADYYNKLVQAQQQAEAAQQAQSNWELDHDLEVKKYEDAAAAAQWQRDYEEKIYNDRLLADKQKVSAVGGGGIVGGGGDPKPTITATLREVTQLIGMNRTPEGMRQTAQKLEDQGYDENLIIQAMRSLGLY